MRTSKNKERYRQLAFRLQKSVFDNCDFREFVILFFLQKYKYLRYVNNKYNHSLMEEQRTKLPQTIGAFHLTKM